MFIDQKDGEDRKLLLGLFFFRSAEKFDGIERLKEKMASDGNEME